MYRILTSGFLFIGLALCSLAAFYYFALGDAPGVIIEEPKRELPDLTAGQTIPIAFLVYNPTRHATQIVGLATC
jgi:hypothetical protein